MRPLLARPQALRTPDGARPRAGAASVVLASLLALASCDKSSAKAEKSSRSKVSATATAAQETPGFVPIPQSTTGFVPVPQSSTFVAVPSPPKTSDPGEDTVTDYFGPHAATILPKIREKSGPVANVSHITIFRDYFAVEVVDAGDKTKATEFLVREGKYHGVPDPVKPMLGRKIEDMAFDAAEIDWGAFQRITKEALAKLPGTTLTHVAIFRFLPFDKNVLIRVFVDKAEGESSFVDFDAKGNLKKVHP